MDQSASGNKFQCQAITPSTDQYESLTKPPQSQPLVQNDAANT